MLKELHIENIAVIEKADIEFSDGFNVLTGETGAGKSIIIDSIGAVIGERAGKDLVRYGTDKAFVSAVFDMPEDRSWFVQNDIDSEDEELIIQRKISSDGKSSCRVCGNPVSVAQLRDLSAFLIDIHGQNDGRQLMDERNHLSYLDRYGDYSKELAAYNSEYIEYKKLSRELEALSVDEEEKIRLTDSLSFQVQELETANIKPGEKDELSARRDILRNFEKLNENITSAFQLLASGDESAYGLSSEASYYIRKAANVAPELEACSKELDEAIFSLNNVAETIRDYLDSLDFSEDEYNRIESRMNLISRLERKYKRDADDFQDYLEQIQQKLSDITSADAKIEELTHKLQLQTKRCVEAAEVLSEQRRNTAAALQKQITEELRDLSMPSVVFCVELLQNPKKELSSTGIDQVRFLMSANAGAAPGRMSKVASGGELSRMMLAMKRVFSRNDIVQTMIFDEIDTGVSGVAAQRVGEKMYQVSMNRQVLCITHLPQIAALADSQFLIEKKENDGHTFTNVSKLDSSGIYHEIARLYGGDNITDLTLKSAEEQVKKAQLYKNNLRD